MEIAAIVVDFRNTRCSACKVTINELDQFCLHCGCKFDRIASNHIGLADKIRKLRGEPPQGNSIPEYPDLVGS